MIAGRTVAAFVLAAGALGWILIGEYTGAVGVLVVAGTAALALAGLARLMGVES